VKKNDIISGLVFAGLGGVVLYKSYTLEYSNESGPGPGFIPFWIGVGFFLLSMLLIYFAVRVKEPNVRSEKSRDSNPTPILTWAAVMISIGLLKFVGFFISFTLLTLALVLLIDRRSLLTALTVALSSAVGFYVVFVWALDLPLPKSPWGF